MSAAAATNAKTIKKLTRRKLIDSLLAESEYYSASQAYTAAAKRLSKKGYTAEADALLADALQTFSNAKEELLVRETVDTVLAQVDAEDSISTALARIHAVGDPVDPRGQAVLYSSTRTWVTKSRKMSRDSQAYRRASVWLAEAVAAVGDYSAAASALEDGVKDEVGPMMCVLLDAWIPLGQDWEAVWFVARSVLRFLAADNALAARHVWSQFPLPPSQESTPIARFTDNILTAVETSQESLYLSLRNAYDELFVRFDPSLRPVVESIGSIYFQHPSQQSQPNNPFAAMGGLDLSSMLSSLLGGATPRQ